MLTDGTDFKCGMLSGVFVCQATSIARSAFVQLQTNVRAAAEAMAKVRADVPAAMTTVNVDGRIGPTTTLAVQAVLAAFTRTVPVPPELSALVSGQEGGDAAIRRTAAQAPEIAAYIANVLTNHPEALQALTNTVTVEKRVGLQLTPINIKGIVLIGAGIAAVAGIALVVHKMGRHGSEDQSHFLPEPEGGEDNEDDDEDDDEQEEDEKGAADHADDAAHGASVAH